MKCIASISLLSVALLAFGCGDDGVFVPTNEGFITPTETLTAYVPGPGSGGSGGGGCATPPRSAS